MWHLNYSAAHENWLYNTSWLFIELWSRELRKFDLSTRIRWRNYANHAESPQLDENF